MRLVNTGTKARGQASSGCSLARFRCDPGPWHRRPPDNQLTGNGDDKILPLNIERLRKEQVGGHAAH